MSKAIKVFIVEDSEDDLELLLLHLNILLEVPLRGPSTAPFVSNVGRHYTFHRHISPVT